MKKYAVLHNTNTETHYLYMEMRTLDCYPGNHIINVKMETKVAWGFPIQ
jgi:hypothetical protein